MSFGHSFADGWSFTDGWYDNCCGCEKQVYLKLSSGVSFARKAHINAPENSWVQSRQGYNGNLGNRGIIGFGVGCEIGPMLAVDITASSRPHFKYKKFQRPLEGEEVTFSRTRRFNLDVDSLMFNFYLNGRGYESVCWQPDFCCGQIYPFFGAGLGVNKYTVYNFRSTGLAPVLEDDRSFTSENEYHVKYSFAYQLMAGLEYREECWAISIGYRWFDGRRFKGPKYLRDELGNAIEAAKPWKMRFSANELLVEAKYYL